MNENGGVEMEMVVENKTLPPFEIKNAKNYDDMTFIRELFQKESENYIPTVDECKIVFCKFIAIESGVDESLLPWPDGIIKTNTISDGLGCELEDDDFEVVAVAKNGDKLMLDPDGDLPWRQLVNNLIHNLDEHDLIELNKYAIDNFVELRRGDFEDFDYMFSDLRNKMGGNGEVKKSIYDLSTLLYLHIDDEIMYREDFLDNLLPNTLSNFDEIIEKGWGKDGIDIEDKKHRILGSLLMKRGLGDVVNSVRGLLADENIDGEKKKKLEGLAKSILNISDESTVYLDLNSVYDKLDFDNYPVSDETRKFRKDSLIDIFDELGVKSGDEILDLGCGTGWLVGDLADAGFSNIKGLDMSKKNLEIARRQYGDKFIEGNWYSFHQLVEKQRVIMSLGRAVPHVESRYNFDFLLSEINMNLDNDGYLIFDMPDPDIEGSEYKKRVDEYRNVLRNLGVSDVDLKKVYTLVDSADGETFYNRYVPSREIIEESLRLTGFSVLNVVYEDLPGMEKDKNMIFVCQKNGGTRVVFE
jgi:SAM-dependent methyltransferase